MEAVAGLGTFAVYGLGGGLGSRYTYEDHPPSVEEYLHTLVDTARRVLPAEAQIVIEPGRSMVAETGTTLCRVVTVKHGEPTFVAVDGGMGDNLEVALYGRRFEATVTTRVGGGRLLEDLAEASLDRVVVVMRTTSLHPPRGLFPHCR